MGVVVGSQRGGDRRGDRCGARHRDRRLVVLTWWLVSGFGGRRFGWLSCYGFARFGSDLGGVWVVLWLALGGWI